MDRVGERRAPRARPVKAGARVLPHDRRLRALRRPGRARPLAGGEQELKPKGPTAEEAGRARVVVAADEVEVPGADRDRAGRAPARAAVERAPADAGERAPQEAAAERAPAEITAGSK